MSISLIKKDFVAYFFIGNLAKNVNNNDVDGESLVTILLATYYIFNTSLIETHFAGALTKIYNWHE